MSFGKIYYAFLWLALGVSGLSFLTHSINDMRLLRKFIQKGQTIFKIDLVPMTLESCQKYTTRKSFPILEDVVDETIGCLGMMGDFSRVPYAFNHFHTSEDFLDYVRSSEFFEYSKIRRQPITIQFDFMVLGSITPDRLIIIDFLDKVITEMDRNEYFQVDLNDRYPEKLDYYCTHHQTECSDKILELTRIINQKKFFCEYTYTWPPERQVFNSHTSHLKKYCQNGFSHTQSLLPYIFWEFNTRSSIAKFLITAEKKCPARGNHEIMITANCDIEFFRKIAYLNGIDPPKGQVYQKIALGAGFNRFLGQAIDSATGLGVHVSDSDGGIFDFQFYVIDAAGQLTNLNHLSYPKTISKFMCGVSISKNHLIAIFDDSILVHKLTNSGGVFVSRNSFQKPLNSHHCELMDFDPEKNSFEWATVREIGQNFIELVSLSAKGTSASENEKLKIQIPDTPTADFRSIKFRINPLTKDVYLAFDFRAGKSKQTRFATFNWDYSQPKYWGKYLGTILDFQVNFKEGYFVFVVGDAPRFYGHEAFNNNNLNYCSAFLNFEKTRLRQNLLNTSSYYFGRLSFFEKKSSFDIGEDFISLCDPALVYGMIGNSLAARVAFVEQAGELKIIFSEQPALVRDLQPWTTLWAGIYDLEHETDDILVFELQPWKFFRPVLPKPRTKILASSQ